jgi:hypothetical protein
MINDKELEQVRKDLEIGVPLNLVMIGRVFGEEFWTLLVLSMMGMEFKVENMQVIIKDKSNETP